MTLISDRPLSASAPADGYRRRAVTAAAIGYGVDGFDLLVLAFALSGIMTSVHIGASQAAFLTTLTLLGAMTGGPSVQSDKLGS